MDTWRQPLLIRAVWQFGGSVFVAVMLLIQSSSSDRKNAVRILALVFFAIGVTLSFNPFCDLFQGPIWLRGEVYVNSERSSRGLGSNIFVNVIVTSKDGEKTEINMAGWEASFALEKLHKFQNQ